MVPAVLYIWANKSGMEALKFGGNILPIVQWVIPLFSGWSNQRQIITERSLLQRF